MPIPASLIASIVSAIIETASQSYANDPAQYEIYKNTRQLPPEAQQGVMLPPPGDGYVTINGKQLLLSPAAQFRSQKNLIVMPMSIQDTKEVIYIADASGAVRRVWLLTPSEASALKN